MLKIVLYRLFKYCDILKTIATLAYHSLKTIDLGLPPYNLQATTFKFIPALRIATIIDICCVILKSDVLGIRAY